MSRVILKSDDSLNYYPNNEPSKFTVKTINLSHIGQHLEVALTEIIFPFGFKNVREGYNEINIILAKDDDNELSIKVKPNFYTPLHLIDEINREIDQWSFEFMKLEINVLDNQGSITVDKKIRMKFGFDVAKILGFNSGEWLTFSSEKKLSPNKAGPYKNISLLNVYCDVVEETFVGENHHQLLRLVNWPRAEQNDINPCLIFDHPYFMRVKNPDCDSIEIKITDSFNIPIEFLGDEPVTAILEFRKIQ